MTLAIVGSRSFKDYEKMKEALKDYEAIRPFVISGGASGADYLAERWAREFSSGMAIYKPDWNRDGKAAGAIRNRIIIKECDECVAFWDGKSPGTKITINLCEKMSKKCTVVMI